jgi:prepilin-type N-terminal cleavage/methylation domain-containing protein
MTRTHEHGFTLIELLIVVAIISIIAAIAVPGLLRAKMTGSETSAIASLKVTSVAQAAYSTTWGNGGYATSYAILGTPPTGSTEAFISAALGHAAPVQKSGYTFNLAPASGAVAGPNDGAGTATTSAWFASADPLTFGTTGTRHFAINAGNTVWQDTSDTPLPDPLPAAASGTISTVQ